MNEKNELQMSLHCIEESTNNPLVFIYTDIHII